MYKSFLSLLFCLLIITSCKEEAFLSGFDQQALFADSTTPEIESVKAIWAARNLTATDYTIEESHEIEGNATLKIVSYRVGGYKEYAALIIPESNSTIPVRMFINGFSQATTVNTLSFRFGENAFFDPFILAIPALRGQSLDLTINGNTYTTPTSEGEHCNAFDGTTDGVIGFLNAIENHEPMADTERVSAQGGSRGGTVAMLLGIRDNRIKRVVSLAGPTNMLELTSQNQNDATYQCQFLSELVAGQVTDAETRRLMIASSPLFFAEDLPLTQLHMGAEDNIVPVSQGMALDQRLNNPRLMLFVYGGKNHQNLTVDNEALSQRIQDFLQAL